MDFSIVTPSYNMLASLKKCVASVSDQGNWDIEHIIIDGGSSDGTVEWLMKQPRLIWVSENDRGMYDAVNKGLKMAHGEIIAYLNCDEQYLPDTLGYVKDKFRLYQGTDVLAGDFLVVDGKGDLIAYRKVFQPRWFYLFSNYLYTFSCAMFFRRKIVDRGYLFDANYRDVGDAVLFYKLMRDGVKFKHVARFMSTFTFTGQNSSVGKNARIEGKAFRGLAPRWVRFSKYLLSALFYSERLYHGNYFVKKPLRYQIYTDRSGVIREEFVVANPTFIWDSETGFIKRILNRIS